jgi:ParB-like chromosome segregation protein Spo0J
MKNHPIADVWPMMDDDKLKELADDISKNGQISPVWLYEGKILDGRNRWAACKIAGVEPTTKEYTGDEPTAFAVAMNDRRRHMNKGALAAVAVELLPFFEADAKKRRKATEGRPKKVTDKLEEKIPQVISKKTSPSKSENAQESVSSRVPQAREEAAKSVGVNDRYVQDAKKVKEEAPEVFEQLKAGKITLQNAKREVSKKPTDDWRQDERDRQAEVEDGMTVVANASSDKNLIAWAEKKGIAVRIDRGTRFGNPFVLGEDGDRDDVCEAYADYYLPHKKGILASIESGQLEGKVLVCHCYPQRCHGDCLAEAANCVPLR